MAKVPENITKPMAALFTVNKAMMVLGLHDMGISFAVLRRAFDNEPMTDEEAMTIRRAWEMWGEKYLKDPDTQDFSL